MGGKKSKAQAACLTSITEPSAADKRINTALGFLDIRVLDHVIVSTHGSFSFAEEGLM